MKKIFLSLALLLSGAFAAQSYAAFSQYNEYHMKADIDGIVEFLSNNPFKLSAPDLIRFQKLKEEWQESKEGKNQTTPVSMWPHMRHLWPSFQLEHYRVTQKNEELECNMAARITELFGEMRKIPQILTKMDSLHQNFFYMLERLWKSRCTYPDGGTVTVISHESKQVNIEMMTHAEFAARELNNKAQIQITSQTLYSPRGSEIYSSLKEMYTRYFTVEAYIEALSEANSNYAAKIDTISPRLLAAVKIAHENQSQMSKQLQEQWCLLNMELTAATISETRFKGKDDERAQFMEELTSNLESLIQQHQANLTQQTNMES